MPKSAAIVLADADFSAVIPMLRYAGFANNGQSCGAHTRMLVPAERHDRFVAELVAEVEAMKVGDPGDPETFIGTLVATRQQERVWGHSEFGEQGLSHYVEHKAVYL